MNSLSLNEFETHLSFMLRTNRELRRDFTDLLLESNQTETKLAKSVIDRIVSHFANNNDRHHFSWKLEIEEILMNIFNNRKFITFRRVMQFTEKFQGDTRIDRDSWARRFRNLAFSNDTGIDLSRISNTVYKLPQFQVISGLNSEQRSVLEQLTTEEIDLLSNFTPIGINVFAVITHFPAPERSFLLSLEAEEIESIRFLGFRKMQKLSNIIGITRNLFIEFEDNDFDKQNVFLEWINFDRDEGREILERIAQLNPRERMALRNLVDEKGETMKNWTTVEGMNEVLKNIDQLSAEDRENFGLLDQQQFDSFKSVSSTQIGILKELDDRVLKFASILTKNEFDQFLLLPENVFETISNGSFRKELRSISQVLPEGKPLSPRIDRLKQEEETVLEGLNQNQRMIIAEIYNLPPRTVSLLFDLDLDQINQVMGRVKNFMNTNSGLNRIERVLLKRMKDLSPSERYNLVHMTQEEWNEFHGIDDKFRKTLVNFSNAGIVVLKAMTLLNEEQLDFVKDTSKTGLAVLAGNSQLTSKTIRSIMGLRNDEEKRFLLNLDLKTRFIVRNKKNREEAESLTLALTLMHKLTLDGQQMLKEIARLNDEEILWMKLLDVGKQTETDLYTCLNKNRATMFADLFDSIDSDEKSVLNLWKLMFDRGIGDDEMDENFTKEVLKFTQTDPISGSKLLANLIIASRFRGRGGLRIIKNSNHLSSIFFIELLRLSVENGLNEDQTYKIVETIIAKGFKFEDLAKVYDYSNRQQIEFFHWMLINSSEYTNTILYNITRTILFDCSYDRNSLVLHAISEQRTDEIMTPLRQQLTANELHLAQSMFFNSKDKYSTAKWLSEILDIQQCLDLLKSDIRKGDHEFFYTLEQSRQGLDVFSILKKDEMKFLEISSYFDRGDAIPLLDKLMRKTIFDFLSTDLGENFFRLSLGNGRVDLLRFLRQRLDPEDMKNLLKKGNYYLVENFIGNVKSVRHVENLATTLYTFHEIDSDIPEKCYIKISSKLILEAQKLTLPQTVASIVRSLITDSTGLEDLINPIRNQLNSQVRAAVFEAVAYGCNPRTRRENLRCIDSRSRQEITEEARNIFNRGSIVDITFYNDLSKYTFLLLTRQSVDPEFGRSFVKKVRNVELDTLDPNIREIVGRLKQFLGDEIAWQNELTDSAVVEIIETSANDMGALFIMFVVGQHVANGDVPNSEYETLNFWTLPKLKSEFLFLRREITKLFAFVYPSRVDLDITGRFIFIAVSAERTVLVCRVFSEQDFWETKFRMGQLQEHMKRIDEEDLRYYWSMLWREEIFSQIENESEAEMLLQRYISLVVDRFKNHYDRIGMSLPRWIVGKTEYYERSLSAELLIDAAPIGISNQIPCTLKTTLSEAKLIFDRRAVVRNPFEQDVTPSKLTLIPQRIADLRLVCGPSEHGIEIETVVQNVSPFFNELCGRYSGKSYSRVSTKRYRLHGNNHDRCQNMVLYEKDSSRKTKILLHIAQDYINWESSRSDSIDLVFLGRDITIVDSGANVVPPMPTNHYVLKNDLSTCKIHKKGFNYFHTDKHEILCDFDSSVNGQTNIVVIQRDFVDSENINSVIGNNKENKITISYAGFVDGRGGNDNIIAGNSTIVRSYSGDLITGGARVILPKGIEFIRTITVEPSTFIFLYQDGTTIELDKQCQFISDDSYFIEPIRNDFQTNRVRRIRVHKILQVDVKFEEELRGLRSIENRNFELIKHLSSPHHDIILTERNHNIFVMDKDSHNYYWEAPVDKKHVYILSQSYGNVTISRMNGILDFGPLNITANRIALSWNDEKEMMIDYENLHVSLLGNYNNVRVTFNGKEYYKLLRRNFERDFCSHPMKVEGKFAIDASELIDLHNCLDFHSDKVYFINSNDNLVLVTGRGALLLPTYFLSNPTGDLELSLKLNSRTMRPDEFRMRANRSGSIKYYQVHERGLQIYHNQPENKHDIGLIDLREWSIIECRIQMSDNALLIVNQGNIILKIENWTTHPPAREIVFVFQNETFLNSACIVLDCSSEDILKEFNTIKSQRSRSKREPQFLMNNDISSSIDSSTKLLSSISCDQFDFRSCLLTNFSFLLVGVESFLHKNHPLPAERLTTREEIISDACYIAQIFEDTLKNTAEEFHVGVEHVDFFDVYANLVTLMENEKCSQIFKTLNLIVESVGSGNKTFLNTLKHNFEAIFN